MTIRILLQRLVMIGAHPHTHLFNPVLSFKTIIYLSLFLDHAIGIQDYEQGIVIAYGKFTRLHLFRAANHHEIVQNVVQAANQYMNITIKVVGSQITLNKFEQEKFGPYSYVKFHSSIFSS